ncbi:MAG: hypothetical protein V3U14_05325 [candidate division NC10 bacterium]
MGSNATTRWIQWGIGHRSIVLCVLLTGTAIQGCATQSAHQIQEPFVTSKHRAVSIEPCEDRTGFAGRRDLAREATRTLTEKVRDSELFTITTEALLVLTCDIERFAEGSALKRWVLPGWGATQARVVVMVWETPGDKVMATLRSQSSVRSGGLYTIGADQYILGVAFDDIVEQLERWATGDTLGGRPLR